MRDLPADVVALARFKRKLEERRQGHLEKMAAGLPVDEYNRYAGRAQEGKALIEMIDNFMKNFDVEGE